MKKKQTTQNNNLYDYCFWYNTYTSTWYAYKREDTQEFFNTDKKPNKFLRADNIQHLVDVINNPTKVVK